jgi:arylsulfatase
MKYLIISISLLLFFCSKTNKSVLDPPNFIFILADDLGYGELGVLGQQLIETPNLDALAKSGMILTDHYSGAPVCAPARAILMTGLHAGHNPVRGNSEWRERGDVWSFKAMFENSNLEGQRPMPDSIKTIANILKSNGYKTGMVGKWGLGAPNTTSIPNKKGFDFFYGYNCQRQAHNLFPTHLWRNSERHILNNTVVDKGKLPDHLNTKDEESYALYHQNDYAPTLMHNEAMAFLDRNINQKFFLYYASPLPHLPLQAPKKWVNYYREKFGKEEPVKVNEEVD